jgi:hypothetical protein
MQKIVLTSRKLYIATEMQNAVLVQTYIPSLTMDFTSAGISVPVEESI